MNFTMNPGTTKTLTVIFQDSTGVEHPLSSVPTCVDTNNIAVIAPVGTQTPADASFSWTIEVLASAVIGSSLSLSVNGTNPDGTVDSEVYPVLINALDDTVQVATLT
jgi:hypothetical protein